MATVSGRGDLKRLVYFSLGGVFVGLVIAGLVVLLIYITAPDRANGWEATDDCVVVTFHLREDATWPDGTSITADDIVFRYSSTILNQAGANSVADDQMDLDDPGLVCEKVDDYIVRFTLNSVSRAGLNALGFDIVPKHRLAEYIRTLDPNLFVEVFTELPTAD
jgi:ABC-type transport system substrate-binding protein